MKILSANLVDFPHVRVPLPIDDYTTRDVLTMEHMHGTKVTRLSPLAHLDVNGGELAEELFRAYLKQVLADGIFHADPHPGNVFLTEDGRIALLDVGMVGHTTPGMQDGLMRILLAISEGDSERALETVLEISETNDRFDEPEFRRRIGHLISEQHNASLEQMGIGRTLLNVNRISAGTGLHVPPELTLLGKTLLQLDQVGRILDPGFDPNATVRRHVDEILTRRMRKDLTAGKVLGSVLQVKDFVGGLPARVNKILDAAGNAELELKVRTPDTGQLMSGFQKIANRITTGLILSALIIGAALLMHVKTRFVLFGYPGLAILCFLIAGGLGLWLVLSILLQDRRDRKKTRH